MRTIRRNPQPPTCLSQQSADQDWYTFMRTDCHREVADSLRREQKHLCCYCELSVTPGDSHVEHMAPRSVETRAVYDYTNLAISCNGGAVEHCGHFKDNVGKNPNYRYDAHRFADPHDLETCRLFHYLPNGNVVSNAELGLQARAKSDYMIGYLGLACPRLTGRRRAHARNLIQTLGTNPAPELLAWAESYYLQPDDNQALRSFPSLSKGILNP